jgi:1-deoxyxylulose-5-phosphate synthase
MSYNRREFIQKGTASLTALSALGLSGQSQAASCKASDIVSMGRGQFRASRLGMGVGDGRGKYYLNMGQDTFTKLIRHGYDQGIGYFDMDACHIHGMMANALAGIERSTYTLVTGIRPTGENALDEMIPRYLKEFKTDYIDGVLIIAIGKADWADQFKACRDMLSHAKEKGWIKGHGVSVHGYEGLKTLAVDPWVDFALISCNHRGKWMDAPAGQEADEPQRRDFSVPVIQQIHAAGVGIASMKTFGADGFENAQERQKAIAFNLKLGCIDTMPIHFKNTTELDQTIALFESAG